MDDLEESDVEMTELEPLVSGEEEVDFGNDDEIPEPPRHPPPDMEEEEFRSVEETTRTDHTYCPPPIPPHPHQSYPTVKTPGTDGSLIWPRIRDLMVDIPAPTELKWDANDSRFNTGQKTGDR